MFWLVGHFPSPLVGERIFGRAMPSVSEQARKVEGSWELSDTPNNPRQG